MQNTSQTTPKQATRTFRVEETGNVTWLTLLEGSKRGLQFGVCPRQYQDEIAEGDVIRATVQSLNEKNTAWAIVELHATNPDSKVAVGQ